MVQQLLYCCRYKIIQLQLYIVYHIKLCRCNKVQMTGVKIVHNICITQYNNYEYNLFKTIWLKDVYSICIK